MWELRLVWPSSKPSAWDAAWAQGQRAIQAEGREVESRPDTYLVVLDRPDIGLKLRGGKDDDFDVKILHSRKVGWELWEKLVFSRWNALEVSRLAVVLGVSAPADVAKAATPAAGARAFLQHTGIRQREVTVRKRRIQSQSGVLLTGWPGSHADPGWLAELAEIDLQGRGQPVFSLCLETVVAVQAEAVSDADALRLGYPELLIRHVNSVL